jgi:hypothetical protein
MMPPPGGLEDPPIRGRPVPLAVGAELFGEFGRDGDGAGLVGGAVLEAAFLAGGAVVCPGAAGAGGGGGQVDPAPSKRFGVLN